MLFYLIFKGKLRKIYLILYTISNWILKKLNRLIIRRYLSGKGYRLLEKKEKNEIIDFLE